MGKTEEMDWAWKMGESPSLDDSVEDLLKMNEEDLVRACDEHVPSALSSTIW